MTFNIEDAYYKANANRFSQANSEANHERRAEEIERLAAESMMEGGEFYPLERGNFAEAVRNMPDNDIDLLRYAYISVPANQTVESYLTFHEKFKGILIDYWKEIAINTATRNYKD